MADMQVVRRVVYVSPPLSVVPYYWEGEEFVETTGGWKIGFSSGTGSQSKQSDHLYMTTSGAVSDRTYVTTNAIDLSNINTLKIEFDATFSGVYSYVTLRVGANTNGDNNTAMVEVYTGSGLQIATLDVSSLSGSYYISLMCSSSTASTTTYKVYKVWGEE